MLKYLPRYIPMILSCILFGAVLTTVAVAQGDDPGSPPATPAPTVTPPAIDIEPVPDNPGFPTEPPQLPDELPQDPNELSGLLEYAIYFGVGLAVMVLTNQLKWLFAYLTKAQEALVRRRLAQIGWAVASVIVSIVMPLYGQLADLARDSGVWGVLLAVLSLSWLVYRGDKLVRIGTRFLAAKFG